jgi:hypothetical protein
VSLVRYDLGVLSQKAAFFIVTAVKTANLTYCVECWECWDDLMYVFFHIYKLCRTLMIE